MTGEAFLRGQLWFVNLSQEISFSLDLHQLVYLRDKVLID
jgi:hypothetical protein